MEPTAHFVPPMADNVAQAFNAIPDAARACLLPLRAMIFETAAENAAIGELSETLKWGQPSYLTEQTKAGSTLRLGTHGESGEPAIFVICTTDLIDRFKTHYPDEWTYQGNRVLLPGWTPADQMNMTQRDALRHCMAMVLTHKLNKKAKP